ncbi:MAG: patatin-like phospholipase family protein, partial [Solirubrobacteraceae bacterium]
MGKVVKLDAAAKERGKAAPAAKQRKTGRRRRSKTALVLGGGGFTGGVYEIGALRALDLLSVNRTVNQFDVYIGTSAGSFVAAMTANGITPEEMMRVVNQQVPTPFRDVDRSTLMRPNALEFARAGALLPLKMLGLAEALPSGIYSGTGIERYVRQVLSDPDRTDDFRLLESELYLVATD